MNLINRHQLIQLHTLLSKANLTDQKEQIVREFSEQGSSSSKELLRLEADLLIQQLKNALKSMDKQRKKMLHYGYLMAFDKPVNSQQNGLHPSVINSQNVSAWCCSDKSKYKKPLSKLNPQELTNTLSQFEQVYKSFNKSISYG